MTNRYQTQWSAQFAAAAELTRRGYLVSLTLGNAPVVDILAVSPSGKHFQIDVKGLSSKNFWLITEREVPDDLYYILVYVPRLPGAPEFFVVGGKELMSEVAALREKTLAAGRGWKESGAGINWGTCLAYRDRWDSLPG